MTAEANAVPEEPNTLSQPQQAFELLMRAIATGQLERGVILKEARLAREFGVGRGALREAVSRLEGLHILQREPNLGIRVIDFFASDISEIFVVREAVEGMASRMAALTITNEELDRLAVTVEQSKDMAARGEFHITADNDFHFMIARATRNRRLIHLVCDDVYFQLRLARHGTITHPARLLAAAQEHEAILEAIGARDADRAEAAMRRHIVNGRAYVEAIQRNEARKR